MSLSDAASQAPSALGGDRIPVDVEQVDRLRRLAEKAHQYHWVAFAAFVLDWLETVERDAGR